MSSKPYRHFIALLLVLFCSRFEAQAEDLFAKTDSTLQQYLIRCKAQIKDPDFLQTNDTLTRMAQEKNDKRMQVIAVALKLDYYYYQNNPDSILVMVDRVKKISRRNNELKYFYFAWGSRLIIYYIKQHQTNTAIYEARKMLQSAEADNFIPGIVQCYRTLGTIYMTQSNPKLAYENFRKQIALIEENEIEDINLPTQYASLAQCALEMHRPDEALKALEKDRNVPGVHIRYSLYRKPIFYIIWKQKNTKKPGKHLWSWSNCSKKINHSHSIKADYSIYR